MKYAVAAMVIVLVVVLVVINYPTAPTKQPAASPSSKAAQVLQVKKVPAGQKLYLARCASCHGIDGKKPALGQSPAIAGRSVAELVNKMEGYRSGTYGGKMQRVMMDQVSKLSEGDIKMVAEYASDLSS